MQRLVWLFVVIGMFFLFKPIWVKHYSGHADLLILSGSENKDLEFIIQEWANEHNKRIDFVYKGSVDIYRTLQQGQTIPYDAVWAANHLWIELGDTQKMVRHEQSIYRSPVVLGVRQSLAQQLGWDKQSVKIKDILAATDTQKLHLAMTSATQSNSGASAYLGFLYAMSGYPATLTAQDLNNPTVQEKLKRLFAATDRSSGSSGWLRDLAVQHAERFDAMFNYESLLMDANRQLTQQGKEPFYVVYPEDGLSVADSPLGLINKGDQEKETLFIELQQYLLSSSVQQRIADTGRRTGLLGLTVDNPDSHIWNPAWGVKANINVASIPMPKPAVLQEALHLYQDKLQKPSLTIWVLDTSGSMSGDGIYQLKQAMTTLLDPEQASQYLLQAGDDDITIVIPFNDKVNNVWTVKGKNPNESATILQNVQALEAAGGTDMYLGLIRALEQLQPYVAQHTLENYLPAVVVMTDGRSSEFNHYAFQQYAQSLGLMGNVPIHAIAFGDADPEPLKILTNESLGKFFDANGDLPSVLREVKGYN